MVAPDDPTRGLLLWLGAGDPVELLVLMCPEEPLPHVTRGTVVVRADRCLAEMDVGLTAQLLASGLETVGVLPCTRARENTETWQRALPELTPFTPPPRGRRPKDLLTLGDIGLPRRVVLGLPVRTPLDLSLDDAARTLAAFQLLLADERTSLPEDAPPSGTGPASAAADLRVSGCTACGVCVQACPHDALTLEHVGNTSTLRHDRESCRSEHRCIELCPVDAITSTGAIPISDVLGEPVQILTEIPTTPCEKCGARHRSEGDPLCGACRFRADNVFGSSLPPGVAEKLAAARRRTER